MTRRILLLGATGRTGRMVIDEALVRGLEVVALARRPEALGPASAGLSVVSGTPASPDDVQRALAGCDAVVSTLNNNRASDLPWARPVSPPGFMTGAMRNAIGAMRALQVRRIVVQTAAGAGDSFADVPWIMRVLVRRTNLAHTYRDHDDQEALLAASGLDWTIVRPVGLHDGEPKGTLVVSRRNDPKPGMRIARQSVARFMLDALDQPTLLSDAPVLSER